VSLRVGIGIGASGVRAVAVRRNRVVWCGEHVPDAPEDWATALSALLARVPSRRPFRPRVVVALGPRYVQVKRLEGLPPVRDQRALDAMVRESAQRFFLVNGVPLDVSGVWHAPEGVAWAAAFERTAVETVTKVCGRSRVSLDGVVPAVAVLGVAVPTEVMNWADGDHRMTLTYAAGHLTGVCRHQGDASRDLQTVPALRELGKDGFRFADAYGAVLGPAGALALAPARTLPSGRPVSRRRLAVAGSAVALAVLELGIAGGASAGWRARRLNAKLAGLGSARMEAAASVADLRQVSGALAQVAEFQSARRSAAEFLGVLGRVLPQGAVVASLRLDSAHASVVVLGPRAGEVVAALETVKGLTGAEVVGPVTREAVGGRLLERVTVRSQWTAGRP